MALALRNKQIFVLIALAVLTLLVIAFVVLGVAHINVFQAAGLKSNPNVLAPWF
jgi:ABC-type molybdate transport system substrate-binding protein